MRFRQRFLIRKQPFKLYLCFHFDQSGAQFGKLRFTGLVEYVDEFGLRRALKLSPLLYALEKVILRFIHIRITPQWFLLD